MTTGQQFTYRVGDIVQFNSGLWHVVEAHQVAGSLANSSGRWENTGICVANEPEYVLTPTNGPGLVKITVRQFWIEKLHLSVSEFYKPMSQPT